MESKGAVVALAERLGPHPFEILGMLVLLVVLAVFLAPRLIGVAFRLLWPVLHSLGARFFASSVGERIKARWPEPFDTENRDKEARGFLSLFLLLGLAAMIGSLSVFVRIAKGLAAEPAIQAFDTALAASLRSHATPAEVLFFSSVTHLAGIMANSVLGLLVTVILVVRRERALLLVWLIGLLGSGVLIFGLKSIFQRPRPVLQNPFAVEPSFSFPSGHAFSSLLMYGLIAYMLILTVPRVAARLAIFATIVIGVSVGMSRMVLGVHYFSDVVAGWALGLAWLSLVLSGSEYSRRRSLLKAGMSDLSVEPPPEEP